MGAKGNIKLIFSHFLLNLKKEWQYKTSFFMQIIMMIFNDAFHMIQWLIIFSVVDDIGGYGFRDVMLYWAIFAAAYGFSHMFFSGAYKIKDLVYDCGLDVYLTQPKNVLINVSTSKTDISTIGDLLYSFIVLIIIGAPWYWYLLILPVGFCAALLLLGVYVTYVSLCFYVKRGEVLAKTSDSILYKAALYPPVIFNNGVKLLIGTIIPSIFMTFIPASYIFISFNIWWLLAFVGVTTLWVVLAFICFNKGLKRYNSGSVMSGRI